MWRIRTLEEFNDIRADLDHEQYTLARNYCHYDIDGNLEEIYGHYVVNIEWLFGMQVSDLDIVIESNTLDFVDSSDYNPMNRNTTIKIRTPEDDHIMLKWFLFAVWEEDFLCIADEFDGLSAGCGVMFDGYARIIEYIGHDKDKNVIAMFTDGSMHRLSDKQVIEKKHLNKIYI
jgi:hypothetical protein